VFIHELGHAMTMNHFVSGTAASWGISSEYPDDGQATATCCDPVDGSHMGHPWSYDVFRRRISTWFRVDSNGAVMSSTGERQGKRDPMNGGEPSNAVSCFPHYTAYHTRKAQRWAQANELPLHINGVSR
jgi:hypothetical protein